MQRLSPTSHVGVSCFAGEIQNILSWQKTSIGKPGKNANTGPARRLFDDFHAFRKKCSFSSEFIDNK